MTAREFLGQYEIALKRAQRLQAQIDDLRSKSEGLTEMQLEDRVQTTHRPDRMEELVAKMTDLRLEYASAEAEALGTMLEVQSVITQVPDNELEMLLWYRYIRLMKWEDISAEMHYEHTWIHALHHRALDAVEKLI